MDIEHQFHMDWRQDEPLPAEAQVASVHQPLHLRSPYNTKSIGHLLRDNLQFLVDLPLRFGRDPVEFDWVRHPPDPNHPRPPSPRNTRPSRSAIPG